MIGQLKLALVVEHSTASRLDEKLKVGKGDGGLAVATMADHLDAVHVTGAGNKLLFGRGRRLLIGAQDGRFLKADQQQQLNSVRSVSDSLVIVHPTSGNVLVGGTGRTSVRKDAQRQ